MPTIVGAAAGGNTSVGASWVGGSAPTSSDEAQIDATTGNMTIDASFPFRSLDCTGYTGTLTHNSSVSMLVGDATAGTGNIALKLVAGMTYTLGNASSSAASFVSTSATVQTIDTGGKSTGSFTYNGVGGSWQLQSNHSASSNATHTLTNGTFDTNDKTMLVGIFSSSNSNVRTFKMGASAINCNANGTSWNFGTVTNLTVTANTATLTQSGGSITYAGGGLNWNGLSVIQSSNGTTNVTGANTVANFTRTGTAIKTDGIQFGSDQIITGTLTFNSNTATNRLIVSSNVLGISRTLTAATVVVSNVVDFMDIAGAGAATWTPAGTGGTIGDCGGNSGMTPTTAVAQAWNIGGGGNWSDVTKWTTRVPLPQDNVTVSQSFAGQTIVADMPRMGANISWAGSTGAPIWQMGITNMMFGSLTLVSGMFANGAGSLRFAGRGVHTITSNGRTIGTTSGVGVYAPGSTYTLQDAFICTGTFDFNYGSWSTNGSTWSIAVLASNITNTRVLDITNSTVNLTSTATATIWQLNATNATFTSTGSTIAITTASANTRTFAGTSQTYGILSYTVAGSTGQLTVTGSNSFQDIVFSDASNARSLVLTSATTTTIRATHGLASFRGTAGNLMTLKSSTGASAATIDFPNGYGGGTDYLSVQDITATTNTLYAGTNSTNVSGNTNVTFTAPPVVSSSRYSTQLLLGV